MSLFKKLLFLKFVLSVDNIYSFYFLLQLPDEVFPMPYLADYPHILMRQAKDFRIEKDPFILPLLTLSGIILDILPQALNILLHKNPLIIPALILLLQRSDVLMQSSRISCSQLGQISRTY